MSILKKENWWVWLLLLLFSEGTAALVLGALLDCFNKEAWYAKWYIWLIGLLLFIFPFAVMVTVLLIQMTSLAAAKLDVQGKEFYLSPYIWIILVIIPIIGWICLGLLFLYLNIGILVQLYNGEGEKYIS